MNGWTQGVLIPVPEFLIRHRVAAHITMVWLDNAQLNLLGRWDTVLCGLPDGPQSVDFELGRVGIHPALASL